MTVVAENLRVELSGSGVDIIDSVSMHIPEGNVLGLVGESGSGKTTAAMALLGHTRKGARIAEGEVIIAGRRVLQLSRRELREIRGRLISYMPQDPSMALNPALRIGLQLQETMSSHLRNLAPSKREERMHEVLAEVKLPPEPPFLRRYPHQLSGGQQQRVLLAMAFACRPKVIVLDEPTTGLDVTTQAHILDTIRSLCRIYNASALYVTHDLAVIADLADYVAVMYGGRIVEYASEESLFQKPSHPYTRELLRAIPSITARRILRGIPGHAVALHDRPRGCFFSPRCRFAIDECYQTFPPPVEVAPGHRSKCYRANWLYEEESKVDSGHSLSLAAHRSKPLLSVRNLDAWFGRQQVIRSLSFNMFGGECLALVGESGSGKTTTARCLAGLHKKADGQIDLLGENLPLQAGQRSKRCRRIIQIVFQNPDGSLNPRQTVRQIIGRPLELFYGMDKKSAREKTAEFLSKMRMATWFMDSYPDQLSGGEKQRVAIARALTAEPKLLICDEITSALDVSVQASIIELLRSLQREFDLTLLFITHNLALASSIADRVIVMKDGLVVESGDFTSVFTEPKQQYTLRLLQSTPTL